MQVAAGLLTGVVLYALFMVSLGFFPVNRSFAQVPEGIEIFVLDNGVHTDLALPVKTELLDWRSKLPVQDYPEADSSWQYAVFGWGDRRFYMETPEWGDLRPGVAIGAALWPTPSAMHVYYEPRRRKVTEKTVPVTLSPEQYEKLVNYITGTFKQQNGSFILIPGKGYTGADNFYEAHGHFSFFRTCNTWTNNALKAAGLKTGAWAILPSGVMRHLPEPEK